MKGPESSEEVPVRRRMHCGWCGHETISYGIGAMFCGPHRAKDGYYYPAKQMHEKRGEYYDDMHEDQTS